MTNALEVCEWLIKRPDILFMAYHMYNAMNTSLDSEVNMSTSFPNFSTMERPIGDTNNKIKELALLWHEEIKCLFLKSRMPPDEAIEELITKIFNYDLCSSNATEVICHSKRVLTDFRSKFNFKVNTKVKEFKEIRRREGSITAPTRTDIEEFMSVKVVERILNRYLKGTNKTKLKRCGTMEQLIIFVREAFRIHYEKYNIEAIKGLDIITRDLEIPSRSGKDIASKISLE
jgi:hypothetical protein